MKHQLTGLLHTFINPFAPFISRTRPEIKQGMFWLALLIIVLVRAFLFYGGNYLRTGYLIEEDLILRNRNSVIHFDYSAILWLIRCD